MAPEPPEREDARNFGAEEIWLAKRASWARWSVVLALVGLMLLAPAVGLILATRFHVQSVLWLYTMRGVVFRFPVHPGILLVVVGAGGTGLAGFLAMALGIAGAARANTYNRTLALLGIGLGAFEVAIAVALALWAAVLMESERTMIVTLCVCFFAAPTLIAVYKFCYERP